MDDLFFGLLGLLAIGYLLVLPVLVIVLLVRLGRMQRRVAALEHGLRGQSGARASPPPAAEEAEAAEAGPQGQAEEADAPRAGPWARGAAPAARGASGPVRARGAALLSWLRQNWVYAVSALSLALAGVFLVQYGVENGLLPPAARVAAAVLFGFVLIAAGDWLRRRSGDDAASDTAYLPSVFSGAGVVSIFGGILAARGLYGLISAETAFAGMVAVTLGALVLGWFYGPLLAAIGLLGGFAAPFLVGGSSESVAWLHGYFGLLAALGLGIDTVRRWAWVSVLTLVLAVAAAGLLRLGAPETGAAFSGLLALLVVLSVTIPQRALLPASRERPLSYALWRRRGAPAFPVWLSAGATLAASALIVLATPGAPGQFWLSVLLSAGLCLCLVAWSRRATGLQDQALAPALAMLALIAWPPAHGEVLAIFAAARPPESPMPLQASWLLGLAAPVSLAFAWRSLSGRAFRHVWASAAVTFLPAVGLALDWAWDPAARIGPYPWALHAIAVAGLMAGLADRFARRDGEDRTRPALAVMSALGAIAFAFTVIFSAAALTVALAAVLLAAALLDRRFDLPPMQGFVLAGIAALGYRLIADPGLPGALRDPLTDVLLAQGASLAALLGAWWALAPRRRPAARAGLESAAWVAAGLLASTLLHRGIALAAPGEPAGSHWAAGLHAAIWLSLALAQMHRAAAAQPVPARLRHGLAAVFAAIGLGWLAQAVLVANPALSGARVVGPPLLNSLMAAYLAPALVVAAGAMRMLRRLVLLRRGAWGLALALAALWSGLAIRHAWQGGTGMDLRLGFGQGELYSYTLALLLLGGGIFYQSLARRSDLLRRAGLAVIALAIVKVFLVDISGLSGLTRVFSLLALGLMLAGMAWIDRWARNRHRD